MSIQEHLNKIRNAIYGREVRESIAKGIETAYDDASENGNANMEVKIARGTHPNLRSRLEEVDNKQQQTTAQLAQTTTQLNNRVSETIATAGDGTIPTELTDMRVDWKGNRFDVAGDRLLNVENMLVNKKSEVRLIWEKGGINTNDGTLIDSTRAIRSIGYYNGSNNSYITIPNGYNFYLHTFDESNNYIVGELLYQSGGIHTLPLEEDKKYKFVFLDKDVHATPTVGELSKLIKIEEEIEIPYLSSFVKKTDIADNPLKNKVTNVLGDSISSVDYVTPNWWQMIAEETGAIFNDYGWSGTTIAHTEDRHLWSSHFDKFPEGTEIGGCMVERYVNMDETADSVIVLGGRNDGDVPRGSWDSIDESTFFGALNVLMVGLLKKFKDKPVIFMTPIQSRDEFVTNVPNPTEQLLDKSDTDTLTAQLRAEAIKLKCKQYSIPCVDLYNESGINGADGEHVYYRNSTDATHPSSSGQERIKNMVQPVLEKHFGQ